MAKRDSFLVRIDPAVLDAMRRWAKDELRSVNAQMEFVMRRALKDSGRLSAEPGSQQDPDGRSSR
ncbi:MAG: DNA-binding protein [Planctomycetaceae bacterium]